MTDSALRVARSFVDAVAWGEHDVVWDLLSSGGRETVLRVASGRGMDRDLAADLGAGRASSADRSRFLIDLVNGLRTDLGDLDLDDVAYERGAVVPVGPEASSLDEGPVEFVTVVHPPAAGLDLLGGPSLPIATIELRRPDDRWLVARIVPISTR